METVYTFSDDFMATLVTLLQLALVTGTDIYDNIATVQMVVRDDGKLAVREEYKEKLRAEIELLEKRAEELQFGGSLDGSEIVGQ